MNIIYILAFVILDALLFPNRDFIPVLFWNLKYQGRKIYPVYRTLQFLLFALGCYLLLTPSPLQGGEGRNVIQLSGFVLAFVLLTTDLLYYMVKGQFQLLINMSESKADTYWLNHPWQAGIVLFKGKGFSLWKFFAVSLTGLIWLILSNFI